MHVHWTDQPLHDVEYRNKTTITAGEGQRDRRRLRIRRVAIANRILSYYGLKVQDWNGSKFVISDKKGTSNIVHDLGGMWKTASDMCHKEMDPLDPDFLKAIQEGA